MLEKKKILDLISQYVELKNVENYYCGKCPFHKEYKAQTKEWSIKNPLLVFPMTQRFRCLNCSLNGDYEDFEKRVNLLNLKKLLD